jgi:hypothetical protein
MDKGIEEIDISVYQPENLGVASFYLTDHSAPVPLIRTKFSKSFLPDSPVLNPTEQIHLNGMAYQEPLKAVESRMPRH